jgi:hypothetical protein
MNTTVHDPVVQVRVRLSSTSLVVVRGTEL